MATVEAGSCVIAKLGAIVRREPRLRIEEVFPADALSALDSVPRQVLVRPQRRARDAGVEHRIAGEAQQVRPRLEILVDQRRRFAVEEVLGQRAGAAAPASSLSG